MDQNTKDIYKEWTIWKIRCKEDYSNEKLCEAQIKSAWLRTLEEEKAYEVAARKEIEQ